MTEASGVPLSDAVSALITAVDQFGVGKEEARRVQECSREALQRVVAEFARDEAAQRRFSRARETLPGLLVAEDVARDADAREYSDEDDYEFSDQTLAVIYKRQEAERLVAAAGTLSRAAELLAKHGEDGS